MKWIKLFSVILCLSISYIVFGQASAIYAPLPEYKMPYKIIYVRFLFELKEYGEGYPGNFSSTNDGGLGGPITSGEDFANRLIARTNAKLSSNQPSKYYIGGAPPPNYDPGYRFQKAASSEYIENNSLYNNATASGDLDIVGYISDEEKNNLLTIVIQQVPGVSLSGYGPEWGCKLSSPWLSYKEIVEKHAPDSLPALVDWFITQHAELLAHELGHSLGLPHAFCEVGHTEAASHPEYMCDDIPTFAQLGLTYDQVCAWGSPLDNNNLMSHGGNGNIDFAITPCQLGLVHYNLCNFYLGKWLHPGVTFPVSVTITSSDVYLNKPYPILGENLTTSGSVELQVNRPTIFVASTSIVLKSGFKASNGADFHAKIIDKATTLYKSAEGDGNEDTLFDKKSDDVCYIWPNPNNGIFTLQLDEPSNVSIYDLKGQLIYSKAKSETRLEVDFSNQPAGLYILRVNNRNNAFSEKIIKQ
jgi:hypothetical protein